MIGMRWCRKSTRCEDYHCSVCTARPSAIPSVVIWIRRWAGAVEVAGGHHFDGDYWRLAVLVLGSGENARGSRGRWACRLVLGCHLCDSTGSAQPSLKKAL